MKADNDKGLHPLFSKFRRNAVETGMIHIFGGDDLGKYNLDLLKDEYARLEQLPSISLVTDEKLWKDMSYCNNCFKYLWNKDISLCQIKKHITYPA